MSPRPGPTTEHWDAVVIGAGMSGATAAALLAAREAGTPSSMWRFIAAMWRRSSSP
jgi:cation diffusion facilitator CzcD-associated flavoprotein CzcO